AGSQSGSCAESGQPREVLWNQRTRRSRPGLERRYIAGWAGGFTRLSVRSCTGKSGWLALVESLISSPASFMVPEWVMVIPLKETSNERVLPSTLPLLISIGSPCGPCTVPVRLAPSATVAENARIIPAQKQSSFFIARFLAA